MNSRLTQLLVVPLVFASNFDSFAANPITVTAAWEPIAESTFGLHARVEALSTFKPAQQQSDYQFDDFRGFLPGKKTRVGETWELDHEPLLPFLRQFHLGATFQRKFGAADGVYAYAVLRAVSDGYLDIYFRLHPQIRFEENTRLAPAQLQGRIVCDTAQKQVLLFRCELPKRVPNFDAFATMGQRLVDGDGAVQPTIMSDAGFIPKMELSSKADPRLRTLDWKESITEPAATTALANRFHPYLSEFIELEQAIKRSQATGKPIYAIVQSGTLDDEACCATGKTFRHVVLANAKVQALLREGFVCTWITGDQRRGVALPENASAEVKRIAKTLESHYQMKAALVSAVFNPELELVGHQSGLDSNRAAIDARRKGDKSHPYVSFLKDSNTKLKRTRIR